MPKPTRRQYKEMWVYIAILTLAIIFLWAYFSRSYWRKVGEDKPEAKDKSWSEMWSEIKQSINRGSEVFSQVKEELNDFTLPEAIDQPENVSPTNSTSTLPTTELIQKLKERIGNQKSVNP